MDNKIINGSDILDLKKFIYDTIFNGIKQIGESGYRIFTASALVSFFKLDYEYVNCILQDLINKHVLVRIYRIYDPNDAGKYIDYTDINKIPKDKYVYYEPTGEKFFVSRYAEVGVFYKFTSSYFNRIKNQMPNYPKKPDIKKSGGLVKPSIVKYVSKDNYNHNGDNYNTLVVLNQYFPNNQYNYKNNYGSGNMTDNSNHIGNISGNTNIGHIGNNIGNNYNNISSKVDNKLDALEKDLLNSKYKNNVVKAKQDVKAKKYNKAIDWLNKIKAFGSISSSIMSVIALICKLSGIAASMGF